MQFTVGCLGEQGGYNATAEILASAPYSAVRTMTVGETTTSFFPLSQLAVAPTLPWSVAGPSTIGFGNWSATSAVCWFYSRDLYDALQVPIGAISSNWGGTIIQSWVDNATNAECAAAGAAAERTTPPEGLDGPEAFGSTAGPNPNTGFGVLFNAMIAPFAVGPLAISSVTWFQGESNSQNTPAFYACAQNSLINSWRSYFKNPSAFVVLEPWIGNFKTTQLAAFRDGQLLSAALPNVGFAMGTDIGDPLGPFGSVHPRNKKVVGARLAAAALSILYDKPTPWAPPRLASAKASGSGAATAVVLTFAPVPSSLVTADDHCKTEHGVSASQCAWFSIVGTDGLLYNATATISGAASLTLTAALPAGVAANGTTFGYSTWPINTVASAEGLPLLPWPVTPLSA